jgi:malate dehydrogenase
LVKVGVVGAGRVGSTAAYTLLALIDLDEIALVDVLGDLAEGEALDLMHAALCSWEEDEDMRRP